MEERIRRALLFMPGDDRHKIKKGAAMDVDAIIMDLEDGVALRQKENARNVVKDALHTVDFGKTERLVRINPVSDEHSLWVHDLTETLPGQPDGYVIPKVESAEQIQRAAEHIARAEVKNGWPDAQVRILGIVETAMGVVNMNEIADSDPRLSALIFGAEDLAGGIGATRTQDGWEVFYARSKLVIYAKARGLEAIDTPFVDLTVEDSHLMAAAEQAHYMGYTGKLAIHPRQVGVIQKVFTPTTEQIKEAKALVTAFEENQAAGKGVFAYQGRMVDMPMVRGAQSILSRAKAAGVDIDAL
jgi:citrate lyase beta subunit